MSLRLYNTLSRSLEPFVPQQPQQVSFYVCGVTVYDVCHIGHARAYVNFDCMRRFLEYKGYTVRYVQNFTDIDDKIINRANERGIDFKALTDEYTQAFFKDMDALGIQRATAYPKATDYIPQMLEMISGLIEKGAAYVVNGDVFASVDACPSYGCLSRRKLDDLQAGIRVDISEKKKNPLDFALWKKSKPNEPSWESPWGQGRPGWHIECSAMVLHTLGETIDIHGGGEDLIFPHHENEICQSESFTGKPLSRYWLHNGFVTVKNEKMSKSKHNFFTIQDALGQVSGEVLRFFLLKVHYRSPLHYSLDGLREAESALKRLQTTLNNIPESAVVSSSAQEALDGLKRDFIEAIDDDFNFTQAIGVLFEMAKLINIEGAGSAILKECGQLLGLFSSDEAEVGPPSQVLVLAQAREDARKNKDFAQADGFRKRITEEFGWILEDTKDGIRWKKA
jgi:cysteinyl-tRNA synthetase